jgi:hypothetical protein
MTVYDKAFLSIAIKLLGVSSVQIFVYSNIDFCKYVYNL